MQSYRTGNYVKSSPALGDGDEDGMPNGWEVQYLLDPTNASDASLDPDGDCLSNLEEYLNNTNPTRADSDGDGINDGDEINKGANPLIKDSDEDGWDDSKDV